MKADPTWHSPDGDGCECLVRDGGDPSKPWELHVADDNQIRVFSVDRATSSWSAEDVHLGRWTSVRRFLRYVPSRPRCQRWRSRFSKRLRSWSARFVRRMMNDDRLIDSAIGAAREYVNTLTRTGVKTVAVTHIVALLAVIDELRRRMDDKKREERPAR